ncbi:hypothetical protein CH299_06985 [Rhodococcus sp. 14-2686-1-2]|nr:hypothetical protein CH301_06440 [Rhodococcus sp. 15-1189-1-1a]OZF18793.1 hypothetical protein CH299_06985 [Rhodococcus sp. 14-2686-1-2]
MTSCGRVVGSYGGGSYGGSSGGGSYGGGSDAEAMTLGGTSRGVVASAAGAGAGTELVDVLSEAVVAVGAAELTGVGASASAVHPATSIAAAPTETAALTRTAACRGARLRFGMSLLARNVSGSSEVGEISLPNFPVR